MAKELDNKKMWESLIQLLQNSTYPSLRLIGHGLHNALESATKDDEIVSIGPDSQRIVSAEAKEALLENKEPELDPCDNCSDNCYMCEHQEHAETKRIKEALDNLESTKESDQLMEFENRLGEILIPSWEITKGCEDCKSTINDVKQYASELLSIARKQIISEIEPEQLTENFKQHVLLKEANGCDGPLISLGTDCYKRGIKHCLDEIELKGIVRKE